MNRQNFQPAPCLPNKYKFDLRKNCILENMKYLPLLFCLCLATLSSCKISSPAYRRVENFRFEREGTIGFTVAADAVFYNPNRVRFSVEGVSAKTLLNDKQVAEIGEPLPIKIKGRQEFKIPLKLSFKGDGDFLNTIGTFLNIVKNREVTLSLQGNVKVKAYCIFKRELPFSYTKQVPLSLLKP
jgi:LEA14-like dessication related protein